MPERATRFSFFTIHQRNTASGFLLYCVDKLGFTKVGPDSCLRSMSAPCCTAIVYKQSILPNIVHLIKSNFHNMNSIVLDANPIFTALHDNDRLFQLSAR